MESVVILYHKNAINYYNNDWLIKCLDTIENQTYKKFDIYEVAYGSDTEKECSIVKYFNKLKNHKLFFFKNKMKDHSYAMNFLLLKVFSKGKNYKYCFNINVDDYYDLTRFERQIKIIKKLNYDLVSSNMIYVDENNEEIKKINLSYKFVSPKEVPLNKQIKEEQLYIRKEFQKNHNIIAHPCACYTKRFWKIIGPYKNIVPREDFDLFKRAAFNKTIKIHITTKPLLYYRIHGKQTVAIERENKRN